MIRYEIRAASLADLDELMALAKYLDSVNLPHNADSLTEILTCSEKSFSGAVRNVKQREYLFVLRDLQAKKVIGTSQVINQLGRRDHPYIYFDVRTEEKYSQTLDQHFKHQVLSIRFSFDGPTELGGLVLHPDYRGGPDKLGVLISYVRFLWIKMNRAEFRDELLAELLPPLESDGTSHLWEAVGRHFTGLNYKEADKLSKRNKEFVRSLFPPDNIYVSMLSKKAQESIGKVGQYTKGVEKMLRAIGFSYVERIDPFDGGPHFMCDTDQVTLVQRATWSPAKIENMSGDWRPLIVGKGFPQRPFFIALPTRGKVASEGITIDSETAQHLQVSEGEPLWATPWGKA